MSSSISPEKLIALMNAAQEFLKQHPEQDMPTLPTHNGVRRLRSAVEAIEADAAWAQLPNSLRPMPEYIGVPREIVTMLQSLVTRLQTITQNDVDREFLKNASCALDLVADCARPAVDTGEWLIWSHQHQQWWKPQERGYTHFPDEAWKYSLARAIEICIHANKMFLSDIGSGQKNSMPDELMVPLTAVKGGQHVPSR